MKVRIGSIDVDVRAALVALSVAGVGVLILHAGPGAFDGAVGGHGGGRARGLAGLVSALGSALGPMPTWVGLWVSCAGVALLLAYQSVSEALPTWASPSPRVEGLPLGLQSQLDALHKSFVGSSLLARLDSLRRDLPEGSAAHEALDALVRDLARHVGDDPEAMVHASRHLRLYERSLPVRPRSWERAGAVLKRWGLRARIPAAAGVALVAFYLLTRPAVLTVQTAEGVALPYVRAGGWETDKSGRFRPAYWERSATWVVEAGPTQFTLTARGHAIVLPPMRDLTLEAPCALAQWTFMGPWGSAVLSGSPGSYVVPHVEPSVRCP